MKPVRVITGTALPLRRADVDTDQIIPAEWLKRIERTGYEKGLFATWRDDREFVLNDERFSRRQHPRRRAGVRRRLVTRARRVGAPAVRLRRRDRPQLLGHLPQQLHEERTRPGRRARSRSSSECGTRSKPTRRRPSSSTSNDSPSRCRASASTVPFALDPATQRRFLDGLDDIGITLATRPTITDFEGNATRLARPDRSVIASADVRSDRARSVDDDRDSLSTTPSSRKRRGGAAARRC